MHWRRKWQPTLVFLPGESQGRGSLVGCRLWGRTESDTTEAIGSSSSSSSNSTVPQQCHYWNTKPKLTCLPGISSSGKPLPTLSVWVMNGIMITDKSLIITPGDKSLLMIEVMYLSNFPCQYTMIENVKSSPTLEQELTKSRGSAFSPCAALESHAHQEVIHKTLANKLTKAHLCTVSWRSRQWLEMTPAAETLDMSPGVSGIEE